MSSLIEKLDNLSFSEIAMKDKNKLVNITDNADNTNNNKLIIFLNSNQSESYTTQYISQKQNPSKLIFQEYLDFFDKIKLINTNKRLRQEVILNTNITTTFSSDSIKNTNMQDKINLLLQKIFSEKAKRHFKLKAINLLFLNTIKDEDLIYLYHQTQVTSLSISACHNISNDLIKNLKDFNSLEKLEFYWMPQLKTLEKFFINNKIKNLTDLNLSGCINLNKESYIKFIERCDATKIKKLNLTRNVNLTNSVMNRISEECVNLEELNLYALSKLETKFIEFLSEKLEVFDICGNQLLIDSDIKNMKSRKIKSLNLVSII